MYIYDDLIAITNEFINTILILSWIQTLIQYEYFSLDFLFTVF